MKKDKTIVVFRRWKPSVTKSQSIIALFPEIPHDTQGLSCASYERVGQHGGADYTGVISRTHPAYNFLGAPWLEEVAALKAELESLGYELEVRQHYNRPKSKGEI